MKNSERLLAAAAMAVVGVAGGWTYGVRPLVERWNTARERVATLQTGLDAARTLVGRKQQVESDRAAVLTALTPPEALDDEGRGAAIPGFLEHLRRLTSDAGFQPGSLRYVRSDAFESYAELRFELRARAPLRQLQTFLVKMAASEWYLRVHALALQPRDDGTVEADVSLVGLATQDALEVEDKPGTRRPR